LTARLFFVAHQGRPVLLIVGSKMTRGTGMSNLEHRLGDVILDSIDFVELVTVGALLVLVLHLSPEARVTNLNAKR